MPGLRASAGAEIYEADEYVGSALSPLSLLPWLGAALSGRFSGDRAWRVAAAAVQFHNVVSGDALVHSRE